MWYTHCYYDNMMKEREAMNLQERELARIRVIDWVLSARPDHVEDCDGCHIHKAVYLMGEWVYCRECLLAWRLRIQRRLPKVTGVRP